MRYAVPYIRVSHADEKRGLTMDLQLDAIRTYAARQGLQLEPECVYLVPDLLDRARGRRRVQAAARPPHEALRALKADFLAERIDANEYTARRAALAQPAPDPAPTNDQAILALLQALPTLLTHATPTERRAVLAQLVSGVYAHKDAVLAFRPTRLAAAMFAAVAHTTAWRDAALTIGGEGGPGTHPAWLHHSRLTPSLLVAA